MAPLAGGDHPVARAAASPRNPGRTAAILKTVQTHSNLDRRSTADFRGGFDLDQCRCSLAGHPMMAAILVPMPTKIGGQPAG
jgi:hypothetical protein